MDISKERKRYLLKNETIEVKIYWSLEILKIFLHIKYSIRKMEIVNIR